MKTVYVTYANALDALRKSDEAMKVYDEGIEKFPGFYQLHFNKGVTLASSGKYDEATSCFQKSVMLNPDHASSHNAIGRLMERNNNRIPSLLAYCRFLVIEPEGTRAEENLKGVEKIVKGNVKQTGKKERFYL